MIPENIVLIITLCTALLAGLVKGFSGFGSAMILVPIYSGLYGPVYAVPVVVMIEVLISLPIVHTCIRSANWRIIGKLLTAAAIATPIGVVLLTSIPAAAAKIIISISILLFAALLFFQSRVTAIVDKFSVWHAGACSGIGGGMCSITGPPVVLFLLKSGCEISVVRSTLICYFLLIDIFIAIVFAFYTSIQFEQMTMTLFSILPVWLGLYIGHTLFKGTSAKAFRNAALIFVCLSAVTGLLL